MNSMIKFLLLFLCFSVSSAWAQPEDLLAQHSDHEKSMAMSENGVNSPKILSSPEQLLSEQAPMEGNQENVMKIPAAASFFAEEDDQGGEPVVLSTAKINVDGPAHAPFMLGSSGSYDLTLGMLGVHSWVRVDPEIIQRDSQDSACFNSIFFIRRAHVPRGIALMTRTGYLSDIIRGCISEIDNEGQIQVSINLNYGAHYYQRKTGVMKGFLCCGEPNALLPVLTNVVSSELPIFLSAGVCITHVPRGHFTVACLGLDKAQAAGASEDTLTPHGEQPRDATAGTETPTIQAEAPMIPEEQSEIKTNGPGVLKQEL